MSWHSSLEVPANSQNPIKPLPTKEINAAATQCSFLIFCSDIHADYVSSSATEEYTLHTNQLINKLTSWKLSYTHTPSHQIITIGVDELFAKYLGIIALLPDPSSSWGIHLASTFWQALTPALQRKITNSDSYHHPDPSSITTKALQLTARTIHQAACNAEHIIADDEAAITVIFQSMTPTSESTHHKPPNPTPTYLHQTIQPHAMPYSNTLLSSVESTISHHSYNNGPPPITKPDGLQYPTVKRKKRVVIIFYNFSLLLARTGLVSWQSAAGSSNWQQAVAIGISGWQRAVQ